MGEALLKADPVSANYGLLLTEEQKGLDIEGISALSDDDLVLGLRAPLLGGTDAVILRVRASELFSAASEQSPSVRVARVSLGGKAGIRDAVEPPIWPAQIIPTQITPPSSDAKAEGIAVLRVSGRTLSILVLFENAERDKPVEHTIQLP